MKVFSDLDEHFQWSSGDQSQTSGFWGENGKRGSRDSRHIISKTRGEMDEYVEVDTGLRKALRVLCLRHLNICVSWRERTSREGRIKDRKCSHTLLGYRKWDLMQWREYPKGVLESDGIESRFKKFRFTLKRWITAIIGGKEMRTDTDIGVVCLQVMDREFEEFPTR